MTARAIHVTAGAAAFALVACWSCAGFAAESKSGMPGQAMSGLMGMDDSAEVGKVMIDQLEAEGGSAGTALAWDAQAWYGGDYDKAWVKTQGTPNPDNQDTSRNELLWDHALARWWDLQAGLRYDLGQGPARGWAVLGVEGLAPYWFAVQASVYLGEAGRTAAHFQVEHDLLITQRLIVQPEIEANLYGRSDAPREIRSGLSDMQVGLRLRYEIRREFAPYVGVAWRRNPGFAVLSGSGPAAGSLQWVAGFHVWL